MRGEVYDELSTSVVGPRPREVSALIAIEPGRRVVVEIDRVFAHGSDSAREIRKRGSKNAAIWFTVSRGRSTIGQWPPATRRCEGRICGCSPASPEARSRGTNSRGWGRTGLDTRRPEHPACRGGAATDSPEGLGGGESQVRVITPQRLAPPGIRTLRQGADKTEEVVPILLWSLEGGHEPREVGVRCGQVPLYREDADDPRESADRPNRHHCPERVAHEADRAGRSMAVDGSREPVGQAVEVSDVKLERSLA